MSCIRNIFFSNAIDELLIQYISQRFVTQIEKLMFIYMELLFEIAETFDYLNNEKLKFNEQNQAAADKNQDGSPEIWELS